MLLRRHLWWGRGCGEKIFNSCAAPLKILLTLDMDQLIITGGKPLNGTIPISGAKNAALPLMAACLLTDKPLVLQNVPHLADIITLEKVLKNLGVTTNSSSDTLTLTAHTITNTTADYDLVRTMRASILVLGGLVARMGEATVSLPGGCAIGTRPVDLHLQGLQKLGATITLEKGYVRASAKGGLKGAAIVMPIVSVGATENLLMAACLAAGHTTISNAAREPEVVDLANCLVAMGAKISGIGTSTLHIDGVPALNGATHQVVADRIEAGTYLIAAAATRGKVTLTNISKTLLEAFLAKVEESGLQPTYTDTTITLDATNAQWQGVDVMTEPSAIHGAASP
jgi:UDP-N-acetylglucosamine 1-carboxyvinyltransferase